MIMKTRIYFLDNLRTFMIFLVIVLHAGIVYEPILENIWIVVDPDQNSSIGLIRMYLDIFVMFTMFFVSGYFIPNSLKSKNTWGFLKSKFKRIMIPWIVAVFTMIPAYKFIFLYSRGLPQEEWYTYFHLFERTGGNLGFYADNPTMGWLWFLPVLFLFQVLYLVLAKTNVLSIKISLRTGVILTFVIGVIYSMTISNLGIRGWFHSPMLHFQTEKLLVYFMVFLLGSLCYKLKVFESNIKNKKYYIWSNIVLTLSLSVFTAVALNFFFNMIEPGRNYFFVSDTVDRVIYYSTSLLSMFSFLYIFIHIFRFRLNKTSSMFSELSKNSYAVYVIHMVVIGVFALMLLKVSIPGIVKFFILAILTFVVSNILVSAYRAIFKKSLSNSILTKAILPAAVLLTIVIYAQKEEPPKEQVQSAMSEVVPEVSIHMAALQGDIKAIHQHIAAGSDLNKPEPSAGSTPLITASLFGKIEVVRALVEAGADVNYQNKEGSTALHTAAFFCHPEIVGILLDNGADKNIRNNAGSTPLESVLAPFEAVKGIYDYFGNTLGPLGLQLDYEHLKITRPKIADMLQDNALE